MEASRQSLEEEMLLRATQESQQTAVSTATTVAAEPTARPLRIAPPQPSQPPATGVVNGEGNAPPAAGTNAVPRMEANGGQNGAVFQGGVEGEVMAGDANGGAVGNGAWLNGWDDPGEVMAFAGKGKGRCRDR